MFMLFPVYFTCLNHPIYLLNGYLGSTGKLLVTSGYENGFFYLCVRSRYQGVKIATIDFILFLLLIFLHFNLNFIKYFVYIECCFCTFDTLFLCSCFFCILYFLFYFTCCSIFLFTST